jgi:hypothetical protein
MKTRILFLSVIVLLTITSYSQLKKVPVAVRESFSQQYPEAEVIAWDGALFNSSIRFMLDKKHMNSRYSNKGVWKYTEEKTSFEAVPEAVKSSFQCGKFKELAIQEVDIMYYPDASIQYRIKAGNNAVEKKFLYYDEEGKLVKQGITI